MIEIIISEIYVTAWPEHSIYVQHFHVPPCASHMTTRTMIGHKRKKGNLHYKKLTSLAYFAELCKTLTESLCVDSRGIGNWHNL